MKTKDIYLQVANEVGITRAQAKTALFYGDLAKAAFKKLLNEK